MNECMNEYLTKELDRKRKNLVIVRLGSNPTFEVTGQRKIKTSSESYRFMKCAAV
jgi:hypothetical protein